MTIKIIMKRFIFMSMFLIISIICVDFVFSIKTRFKANKLRQSSNFAKLHKIATNPVKCLRISKTYFCQTEGFKVFSEMLH